MRFKNKVVLITGSSRGIGRATALLFAKEGANVVVTCSKSEKEANEVVNQIKNLGSDAVYIQCDVSDEEQVKNMINQTIEKFGKIDILVNNAGVVFDAPFKERTVEQWKRTLNVNLLGTFLCAKYASTHIPKGGTIVNVSSTSGLNSFSTEAMDYDASKAGAISLTRDLAKELAPDIRVNSVAPGWVDTDMNKDLPEDFVKAETEKIYMKRFAQPEEIAKVILFFASDDASFVNGVTLVIDGGYG